jgi:branched-chain amino acid transport system substrate-binding protein
MKRHLFLRSSLPVLAVLVFGVTGCKPKKSADIIRVGEYASLTGDNASFGQSSHKGTAMAVEEINAAGGLLGKKLELITEDNRSTAGESSNVVKKLISRDEVVVVLGEVASKRSQEAAPICQGSKIPMISPASTNEKVTQEGDYISRICFIDPFQGQVMGKFAKNTLKATKVAVLTDVKNPYSVGLAKAFKDYFPKNGGTIVSEQSYSQGDVDFKGQLTAIKGTSPEAIFVPGYYDSVGIIARQARELGITVPLLGGDGWVGASLLELAGTALENCYFSNHYSAEDKSPVIQDFIKKYKEKYKGEEPDAMAALGYDSAMFFAAAVKRAESVESVKLRDAINSTKDFEGVTGKISLDANRNAVKSAVVLKIVGKDFKYVETIAP